MATNRPSCPAAGIARDLGIPLGELSLRMFRSVEDRDIAMRDFFVAHGVELVVDAGYDRIHSAPFLEAFAGRIINVHPSLLPRFAGVMDAIEQALAAGAKETGATVHLVTPELDAGPILLQRSVPIFPDDNPETLRERVHAVEYEILPEGIRMMEARLEKSPSVG